MTGDPRSGRRGSASRSASRAGATVPLHWKFDFPRDTRAMLQMRPMTAGEFHAYRTRAIDGYARDLVSSGQNATDDAASRARACFDTLLPDGLLTSGQTLVQLIDAASGDTVGDLWYAIVPEGPNRTLFIYDLDIVPSRRRQGWATRALDALEAEARRHGVTEIGLSVFNHNTAARALYRACGFVPITTTLIKPVVPG